MVRLTEHESLSRETVRRRLTENALKPWREKIALKPWREKMWCVPKIDGGYVARMEDVPDLYAEPPDPARPVVCLDERPVQLLAEARPPLPPRPGQPARRDAEYVRAGTACLAVAFAPHPGWRHVIAGERRTKRDFAGWLKELIDVHVPDAERIRLVVDNLNTHTPAALYDAFPPAEAHRLARKLEFLYTP